MTQENKELLLKDLSARFSYHPYIYGKQDYAYNTGRLTAIFSSGIHILTDGGSLFGYMLDNDIIKPYLRPMSSMTNKERKESNKINLPYGERITAYFDFLNSHHFDYRGLIEKGLALEATEGMYKFD